jgi:hypothetical protein
VRLGFHFAVSLLLLGVAAAQVYPGGPTGYPGGYPGRYPGAGSGIPIPVPGRKSKTNKNADSTQPMPNFRGTLKRLDDKVISIELGDYRVLDFKRTAKTKFFQDGKEVKPDGFHSGDQVSVEGPEDQTGTLIAVNVYWEKPAAANTPSTAQNGKDQDRGVVDAWAIDSTAPPAGQVSSASPAGRVPAQNPDDPGPPKLKRGAVADPSREHASEPNPSNSEDNRRPEELAHPQTAEPGQERAVVSPMRPLDPLIRRAADTALDFTATLPSYTCEEVVTRYESHTKPVNWKPVDVMTMNVVYNNGKEEYHNIAVNGKRKESFEETGGAWSTGEFGTVLVDLFSPLTAADFVFRRNSRIAGIEAKVYDFAVKRENSYWQIHVGPQSYQPAYQGAVWIDPASARVLRIEMQAAGFPEGFPADQVESATDYQYVRLGDARQYLLPVHAETLSCQRGTNFCSRNVIDFRHYHKYASESTVTYGAP